MLKNSIKKRLIGARKILVGLKGNNTNKKQKIYKKEETKRESKSVPPDHNQQSQGLYRTIGNKNISLHKSSVNQHLSENAEGENGKKCDQVLDKDSGESSQKLVKLEFKGANNIIPKPKEHKKLNNTKKSDIRSKSGWSSSNDVEVVSP